MDYCEDLICRRCAFFNPGQNSHYIQTLICSTDGGLSHEPDSSPSLSDFGGASERSPLVAQTHCQPRGSPSPPPILHDLQQSDSTSYVLLNLAKGKGTPSDLPSLVRMHSRVLNWILIMVISNLSLNFQAESSAHLKPEVCKALEWRKWWHYERTQSTW